MTTTLVLNASYEPLEVVSQRRAVVLVLGERAELVDVGAGEFRSASLRLPAPTVIRLLRYIAVPHRSLQLTKHNILARDHHRCAYCQRSAATIDHIVPKSRGGTHEWSNVVAACGSCNHKKADRTPAEAGLELHVTPYRPTGDEAWRIRHGHQASWDPQRSGVAGVPAGH